MIGSVVMEQLRRQKRLLQSNPVVLIFIVIFGVLGSVVIVPLALVLFGALWSGQPWETEGYLTLQHFYAVLQFEDIVEVTWNTIVVSVVSTVVGMTGGIGISIVLTRCRVHYRRALTLLMFLPFAIPSYLVAIGWIFLMSPERGMINGLIESAFGSPLPFYNEWAIGLITGASYIPLVYFIAAPSIRQIDSTLESASFVHGATLSETLRSITLPMSRPAILSTLIIVFIKSFEEFAVALWIGLPSRTFVLSTKIFNLIKFQASPEYGPSTALAFIIMFFGIVMVTVESKLVGAATQYQTVGGESYSTRRVYDLGPLGNRALTGVAFGFLFISTLLPLLVLIYSSFVSNFYGQLTLDFTLANYVRAMQHPAFFRSIWNTFLLSTIGPIILMVVAFFSSYILFKTDIRGKKLLDYILFLPITTPAIVTAVGFLWFYLFFTTDVYPLYGTLIGIGLALISRYVPYATRAMHSGMAGIDDILEEAAYTFGGGPIDNLRDIIFPNVAGNFVYGYILLMMFFIRNFTVVVFLYTTGQETLAVLLWILWETNALWGATAATSVVMMAFVTVLGFGALRIGGVEITEM